MADAPDPGGAESPGARAYRRGFKQKNRRDDYALDLFQEARARLAGDAERLAAILAELARLYNPVVNGPIMDLPTRNQILALVEAGRDREARDLLDQRYRLYAPLDDSKPQAPGTPGA